MLRRILSKRKAPSRRGASGQFDSDSENSVEVDVSGVFNGLTGRTTRDFTQVPAVVVPRAPMPVLAEDLGPDALSDSCNQPTGAQGGKEQDVAKDADIAGTQKQVHPICRSLCVLVSPHMIYQGASAKMDMFAPHFESLQESIMASQTHIDLGKPCSCTAGRPALFRCSECRSNCLLCRECILKAHTHHPLHFLSKHNGKFFEPTSLHAIGYCWPLGHQGQRCPNRDVTKKTPSGRTFVIGHTNGFHKQTIEFCHCANSKSEFLQLADAELFAATVSQPESVFTFALLDNWHQHTLASKKSAHDFHDALRKLTDPVFLDHVPVCSFRAMVYLVVTTDATTCRADPKSSLACLESGDIWLKLGDPVRPTALTAS